MDGGLQSKRYDLPVWVMVGAFFYFNHHESDPKLPVDGVAQCRIASEAAGLDIPFTCQADLYRFVIAHCAAAGVRGGSHIAEYYWLQERVDSWQSLFSQPTEQQSTRGIDTTPLASF